MAKIAIIVLEGPAQEESVAKIRHAMIYSKFDFLNKLFKKYPNWALYIKHAAFVPQGRKSKKACPQKIFSFYPSLRGIPT